MADSPPRRDRRPQIAWIILLTLAGCGGGGEDTSSPKAVGGGKGTVADSSPVVVDGSSTVFPISQAAQEEMSKVDAKVEVVVSNSGTSGGFAKYLKNEVDIVDASRPAKADEESKAKAAGMDWVRFVVGYDGITVVVSSKNDFVTALSVGQLKKLWEPASRVKSWKDLDPTWSDREIKLYSPDDKSGTFEFFTEAVVGKAKSQRKDVQQSSDDNTLVIGVGPELDAIGYFGYAYYKANEATLKAVPIKKDDAATAVSPNPQTILDKTYTPLSRPLFIYVKKSSLSRPGVSAFVNFYLEHVADLATKAKYVAPTPDDIKANQEILNSVVGPKSPSP